MTSKIPNLVQWPWRVAGPVWAATGRAAVGRHSAVQTAVYVAGGAATALVFAVCAAAVLYGVMLLLFMAIAFWLMALFIDGGTATEPRVRARRPSGRFNVGERVVASERIPAGWLATVEEGQPGVVREADGDRGYLVRFTNGPDAWVKEDRLYPGV